MKKKPTILIVEDEAPIMRALVYVLTAEGFVVLTAENGKKGLAMGIEHRPDLIILDIIMPVMDGMAMLKMIRETGGAWGKKVKAIVYSNLSYNEKREEAGRLMVMNFLVKANTSLGEVVQKVKAALGQPPR